MAPSEPGMATVIRLRSRDAPRHDNGRCIAPISPADTVDAPHYATGVGMTGRYDSWCAEAARGPEIQGATEPATIRLWDGTRITFSSVPALMD